MAERWGGKHRWQKHGWQKNGRENIEGRNMDGRKMNGRKMNGRKMVGRNNWGGRMGDGHMTRFFQIIVVFVAVAWWPLWAGSSNKTTGILTALPEEMRVLSQHLKDKHTKTFLGVTFHTGKLQGRKVILATTGIGKVNAAKTAALLLDRFHPGEVIFSGVAGGLNPDLAPGDIVVATRTAQHDFGKLTERGFEPQTPTPETPLFIAAHEGLLRAADRAAARVKLEPIITTHGTRMPRVIRGVIITGDVFVASSTKVAELRETFKADAVEMEGAAVALVCWQQRVPCMVIRSISDKADVGASEDFERFIKMAADNSARFTLELLKAMVEQPIGKQ